MESDRSVIASSESRPQQRGNLASALFCPNISTWPEVPIEDPYDEKKNPVSPYEAHVENQFATKVFDYVEKQFGGDWERVFKAYSIDECSTGTKRPVLTAHKLNELLVAAEYSPMHPKQLAPDFEPGRKLIRRFRQNAITKEQFLSLVEHAKLKRNHG